MTQVRFYDRVRVNTAATGSGSPITLGTAVATFRTFVEAGVPNGVAVPYTIEEGSEQEVGHGVYATAGNTLTRVVSSSSNAGARIVLAGNAQVFITPTAASLVGRQTIGVPADAMRARTTNGAAALSEETTTNKNMVTGFRFEKAVDRFVQFRAPMPASWNLGVLKACFRFRCPVVTSGTVQWLIKAVALKDDTPSDIAFGDPVIIQAIAKSTAGNAIWTGETAGITVGNAPAYPCTVQFEVARNGAHPSDTADGDADLLEACIFYDTLALVDG